ncbi:lysophospholipase [Paenibacillus sp. Root52]|uniref:Lysophospholipase L1-like esterase n=1 Tax=Paenibacillus amylolyticus TaxID=1451 RepID=A0AAP5LM23_PAEAM|nr:MULTISPECIES: GDSL-type esterase/lipase family protein [Paenibacillus]KQY83044.1 lysophospholipase [Paenibacillus sp. Root52]MDR6722405.1 lysophospholipase L1-like esterase [Paenibacillus amylolyticus]
MVYRYAAIGDSLTVGTGALLGTGFVPLYRRMAEINVRTFVSMDNMGMNGLTSGELLQMVSSHNRVRQSLREADIITISIGGNDLIRTFKASNGVPGTSKMTQVLGDTRNHVSQIMKQIRQLKGNSVYMVRTIGLYNPFPQAAEAAYWVQQYNSFLNGAGSRYYACAQVYDRFLGHERELLFWDRVHPNARGYRVIADQLNRTGYIPFS